MMPTKSVVDLLPGDIIVATRTVKSVQRDATTVTVRYEDGTCDTFTLADAPAVEVP